MRIFLPLFLAMALLFHAPKAQASSAVKVFVLTSTYGVMAGALTGFASLAFYKEPSDHMRNVAIGASLGLYTGLLLGAYVLYLAPDNRSADIRWMPLLNLNGQQTAVGFSHIF